MKNILFVCTGNTCRSPMAEALFNRFAKEKNIEYKAASAGVCAPVSLPVSENSKVVLSEIGIDMSEHQSRQVSAEILLGADVIVTMTNFHKFTLKSTFPEFADKIYSFSEYTQNAEGITDPFGGDIEIYRKCRNEIEAGVKKILDVL